MAIGFLTATGILSAGALVCALRAILLRRHEASLAAGGQVALAPPVSSIPPKILAAQEDWSRTAVQDPESETCIGVKTKAEAEDLLDWLERNGYQSVSLSWQAGEGFTIRFRMLPAGSKPKASEKGLFRS